MEFQVLNLAFSVVVAQSMHDTKALLLAVGLTLVEHVACQKKVELEVKKIKSGRCAENKKIKVYMA